MVPAFRHKHKITDGTEISIDCHSTRQCHIQNSIMHKWIKPCTKFYQLPSSVPLLFVRKKNPLVILSVKLPHLITSTTDTLLSTNDHMKCKNNMKADNLSSCNTDPRKSKPSSLKILVQRFLSDSSFTGRLNSCFNVMGYYWERAIKEISKEKHLRKIKV